MLKISPSKRYMFSFIDIIFIKNIWLKICGNEQQFTLGVQKLYHTPNMRNAKQNVEKD